MQNLDLNALEIFRMVASEGSVTNAAKKLNRVQSNISTRIKQLEQSVGKTLFLRQNRRLNLTPDGQILLTYAERLLQLSMEASEALNEDSPAGLLRIGTMESTAAARLPEILSRYHQTNPDVSIELETDVAAGLVKRLRNYDIDVAFLAEPVSSESLSTRPVFTEKLLLIAPRSFPPLGDMRDLDGRILVAFETGCAYRRYLEDWLSQSGIRPGGVIALGSYLAILACVSAGTGFAVVPERVLHTVASRGAFQRYPLPGAASHIRTLMAWRKDYRSARLDALMTLMPET